MNVKVHGRERFRNVDSVLPGLPTGNAGVCLNSMNRAHGTHAIAKRRGVRGPEGRRGGIRRQRLRYRQGEPLYPKITSAGVFVSKWGAEGSGDGEFYNPWGVAVASDGSVYVVDMWNHRIQKFTSDGHSDICPKNKTTR